MDKQIRWKVVFIGVGLIMFGFVVGVVGTVGLINNQLGYSIKIGLELFK